MKGVEMRSIKPVAALASLVAISVFVCAANAQKMYWTDIKPGKIVRAELDGQNVETLIENRLGDARGMAIDLDDFDDEVLVNGISSLAMGIALDLRLAGDCDLSGDVGLSDYVAFSDCVSGPDAPFTPGCSCADFDGNGHVDVLDFGAFQLAIAVP